MSNKLDRRKTSFVIFVLTMIFFYLPLAVLVIYSFNNGKGMAWQGFSLRWYKELFRHSSNIWKAFYYSIFIALISSFVSTVIGTFGAIALKWFDFKGKKYLKNISVLPLVVPDIIIGVSLLIMFATVKFKLGITTIFIAHTTFNIPYVLFIILSRLDEFDFVITFFVSGPGSSTLPLRIYSMIRLGVSPVVNALSVLLIAISILLTLSTKKLQKNFIK